MAHLLCARPLYAGHYALPLYDFDKSGHYGLTLAAEQACGSLEVSSTPSMKSENFWDRSVFSPAEETTVPLILRSSADSTAALPLGDHFDLDDLETSPLVGKQGSALRGPPTEDDLESWLLASLARGPPGAAPPAQAPALSAVRCTMGPLVGITCSVPPPVEPAPFVMPKPEPKAEPRGALPAPTPEPEQRSGDLGRLAMGGVALTRRERVERYLAKRARRSNRRVVRYHCRKVYADARPRIKGRFVTPEELEAYRAAEAAGAQA
ncbi:hypothetical protein QBZ16_003116 [Prototheca wickerhamii]|uniref:CCT domain-containing protein n=1 Tax=Prototheca wickerhamii TaxID=3111 RepID=A0AAD9MI13_PROWI|nr:hypothetical protein QBZ16_003116 [Prototheca wickerhamii]